MSSDKDLMTPEAIENLGELLSADGINFVRANQWGFDHKTNTFFYDGSSLQGLTAQKASGLTFHNMSHARFSMVDPSRNLRSEFQKFADDSAGQIGAGVVPVVYKAIADERAEHRMRERYQNLGNADLPQVGRGYRKELFDQEVQAMQTVSTPGELDDNDIPVYWKRAATAIRGISSGYLDKSHLPPDMQWSDELIQRIKDTVDIPTAEGTVDETYSILKQMMQERMEEQQPDEGEGEGDGQSGEGKPDPNGKGKGKGKPGQGEPGEGEGEGEGEEGEGEPSEGDGEKAPTKPKPGQQAPSKQEQSRGARAEAVQSKPLEGNTDQALFGGSMPGTDTSHRKPVPFSVSYAAIRGSVIHITNAIKKAINLNLKDNEVSSIEHGNRSGRVSGRHFARFAMQGVDTYHVKRSEKGEKQYAFAFAIDTSGSMGTHNDRIESHPELFDQNFSIEAYVRSQTNNERLEKGGRGMGASRCEFAVRSVVAFVEAFARFKEVKTSVSTFTGAPRLLKKFNIAFTDDIKQKMVDSVIRPGGGTSIYQLCVDHINYFREVSAEGKALVILTDGDLSHGDRRGVEKLQEAGVVVIGILLDCPGESGVADEVFGKGNWDNVTEYTVGRVIGRHLRKVTVL